MIYDLNGNGQHAPIVNLMQHDLITPKIRLLASLERITTVRVVAEQDDRNPNCIENSNIIDLVGNPTHVRRPEN